MKAFDGEQCNESFFIERGSSLRLGGDQTEVFWILGGHSFEEINLLECSSDG